MKTDHRSRTAKKRQCVLCDEGKVVTEAPKNKAVCHTCAMDLMEPCTHVCQCSCHTRGNLWMECFCCQSCHLCGKQIVLSKLPEHRACHAALIEFQTK